MLGGFRAVLDMTSETAGTPEVQALGPSIWPPQVCWNDSSPVTFVIKRTKGDGSDQHGRRVSGQSARLRRARGSDARLLCQGTIARTSEEVADHGHLRRKARALGRLTLRPRHSAPFRLASPTPAIAASLVMSPQKGAQLNCRLLPPAKLLNNGSPTVTQRRPHACRQPASRFARWMASMHSDSFPAWI